MHLIIGSTILTLFIFIFLNEKSFGFINALNFITFCFLPPAKSLKPEYVGIINLWPKLIVLKLKEISFSNLVKKIILAGVILF